MRFVKCLALSVAMECTFGLIGEGLGSAAYTPPTRLNGEIVITDVRRERERERESSLSCLGDASVRARSFTIVAADRSAARSIVVFKQDEDKVRRTHISKRQTIR